MNKKELSEIKKAFNSDNGTFTINNIVSSVISDHLILSYSKNNYNVINENMSEQILINLKNVLKGPIDKNTVEYKFTDSEKENFFYDLNNSKLSDEDMNKSFIQDFADNAEIDGLYSLFLADCVYTYLDKQKGTSDFHFIISAICPISVRIDGLIFNDEQKVVAIKEQSDMIVSPTIHGFMFPTFSDRMADVNHFLYYCKKTKEPNISIIEKVLGGTFNYSSDAQNNMFKGIMASVSESDLSYDFITDVNHSLQQMVNNNDESGSATIGAQDIKSVLKHAGTKEEQLSKVDDLYKRTFGDKKITVANLCTDKIKIKNNDISISVNSDKADCVQTKTINGKKCIVIELDDSNINVNDISISVK